MRTASSTIAFALLLAGCGGTPRLASTPAVTVTNLESLPAPNAKDRAGSQRPYLIGPFDKLSVSVFGIGELSQKVQADASGRITLPLVGQIQASGLTSEELAREVENRLRGRYVREPHVTINVEETVSQVISIDGEVKEPGLYPVVGRMTLMRAVATAKGVAEFANLRDVVIFREVGGRRFAGLYNLQAIRRGVYADPEVFANDRIVVGTANARRIFKDALQLVPLVTTPLIVALQNN
jgi:polysaccharide biosynthesis/export protein